MTNHVGSGGQSAWVNPFTNYNANGLSYFESLSTRYWAHDQYIDGKNNGQILLNSYFNPTNSLSQGLVDAPGGAQTLAWHLHYDQRDDGVINGTSLKNVFGHVYRKTTGHNISPQLNQFQNSPASWHPNAVMANYPDPQSPEGFQALQQRTGWNTNQVINSAVWGHDIIDRPAPFGRTLDGSVLEPSLNNPNSIDYGIVNGTPGGRTYVQGLINRDQGRRPGTALNNDFLNTIFTTTYGQQNQYNPYSGFNPYGGGYNNQQGTRRY